MSPSSLERVRLEMLRMHLHLGCRLHNQARGAFVVHPHNHANDAAATASPNAEEKDGSLLRRPSLCIWSCAGDNITRSFIQVVP